MYFGPIYRKRRCGFTLIEIVIAITLFLVIAPVLLTTLKISSARLISYLDYRKAFNRTSTVIALLKAPVFYCGFGMPVNAERYRRGFGDQQYDPFRWQGPISVKNSNGRADSELRITYARPGSTRLAVDSSGRERIASLTLSSRPEESEIASSFTGNAANTRNWIFFAGTMPPSIPFRITSMNGAVLTVSNNMSAQFSVHSNDRCYLLGAMMIYCNNDIVYTRDFRASGDQPRVNGVADIRFSLDLDKRLITVYILSRGDNIYDVPPEIIGRTSWPPEYISQWISNPSKYQLYASKIIWRLPNCKEENVLEGKDIEEAF